MQSDSHLGSDPVIVTAGDTPTCPGVRSMHARHRSRPDVVGEGETIRQALDDLLSHLSRERDNVADSWHRQVLERVISEVRASIDRAR